MSLSIGIYCLDKLYLIYEYLLDNDAKAYSGLSGINDLSVSINDKQIFSKRYLY